MASSQKRIIIIGAGISGLVAGVYAQRSGFAVSILEQHNIPGGLSTSWSRKGYLFEGGMHWLTGSSPELELNRVWHEVGALKENNPIFNRDPYYTLIDGDKRLNFYRDVSRFEKELLAFAPEDKRAIKRLCRDIRFFKNIHMIITDVPGVKVHHSSKPSVGEVLKMVPAVLRVNSLRCQSYVNYVAKFKNDDVRHLLLSLIGYRYNALSFVYTLASFSSGDCGYPQGGSLRMSQNIADTFTSLGGTIAYSTKVEKIAVTGGRVTGVMVNGILVPADAVIVATDTRRAIDTFFELPLAEKWTDKMRRTVVSEQSMFLCAGIKADLSKYPACFILPLKKPFEAAGLSFTELRVNNYASLPGHAPDGCSAVTCLLLGSSYEYWKARKNDGTYKQQKEELMQRFLAVLAEFVPEIKNTVEVTDVATPCTYERYTSSFEGSWMSVWQPGGASFTFPSRSSTISGLYFASERTMMPGGLPICAAVGRKAAQCLCRDNDMEFMN